jgi:hypothetical protein
MPDIARRGAARRVAAAALALAFTASLAVMAAPAGAHDPVRTPPRPPGLRAFMEALAAVESGGRYDARNRSSGAYGRYQIMPSNWPAWARIYLGDRRAPTTPRNQDRVAAGRLSDLHASLDGWDRVAHWWLTGDRGPRSAWSAYSTRYVTKVITGFRTLLASPDRGQARRVVDDGSEAITYLGAWWSARHPAYSGDRAHVSTRRGASLVVRFTGRSIALVGPVGPTRGRAAIYLDGVMVRTIDLGARHFDPRRTVFSKTWRAAGTHRLVLRVLGTKGRAAVSLDRVVVGR